MPRRAHPPTTFSTDRRREIASRLATVVRDSGRSLNQIAQLLGGSGVEATRQTLQAYVDGERDPSGAWLHVFAHLMGVRPAWLLTGEGERVAGEAAAGRMLGTLAPWLPESVDAVVMQWALQRVTSSHAQPVPQSAEALEEMVTASVRAVVKHIEAVLVAMLRFNGFTDATAGTVERLVREYDVRAIEGAVLQLYAADQRIRELARRAIVDVRAPATLTDEQIKIGIAAVEAVATPKRRKRRA